MSSVIVEVVEVDDVKPHPNADRLFLAQIKGWQTIIRKLDDGAPEFPKDARVVYIPPDSTLTEKMAERLNVTNYLSRKTDIDGEKVLVVRRTRLRGEPSYGFVIRPEDPSWPVGRDVREHYGIEKYQPPVRITAGDAETPHPLFHAYTEIENLRHFPNVISEGENVIITEKIHGTNSRIGYIDGTLMAGSLRVRRREPEREMMHANTYWFPATLPGVMSLLLEFKDSHKSVILFGEVYGQKIQKRLHYGSQRSLGYAAFDLCMDGEYVDFRDFVRLCGKHAVRMAPPLYHGPFSLPEVKDLSSGTSELCDDHIQEGVVVKPLFERTDPKIGRVILKYVSDDYLTNSKLADADVTDL